LPRTEDFALPSRSELLDALRDLDRPWTSGPFAERTRQLLRRSVAGLQRLLRQYDELAAEAGKSTDAWVVTHGEPHGANVIRDARGNALLVDWDTTLLAPRERDLRFVLDDDLTGWEEYRDEAGAAPLDERALRLYRLGWDLADIAIYTRDFRRAHDETEDTVVAWESLTGYLPVPERT
jgi:spectinomycin phosphotransferase